MLSGASLVYACFGALLAAMTVLVKPISEALSLSPFQMGTILSAWQFVYLFAAIPAGALLDRFGVRPCLLLAGLILTASSALRIVVDSYFGLLFAMLFFGLGGPLISVGAPKLVRRWFAGSERGLAIGIYMSSTGIGALLAIIWTNSIIMPLVGDDWHAVFGVYTIIMLISVIGWFAIASHPTSKLGSRTSEEGSAQLDFGAFRKLLVHGDLRLTMIMAIAMFFFVHATLAWLPEILRAKGLSLVEASYWAGLPAVVAIVAALVITRLALPQRRIAIMLAVSITAAVSAMFLEIQPVVLLALCLTGLGIARSCLVPIALLTLMDNKALASNSMGAASGLFFTTGQIGGVLGPLLCGLAITVTGNYNAALWLMAVVMLFLFALILRLGRYA